MPSTRQPSTTRRGFLAGSATLAATALAGTARAAQSPSLTWSRTYAPGADERTLIRDVVPTDDGFFLVGLAGGMDYRGWVGAVDAAGRSRWQRLLGIEGTAFMGGVPAPEGTGVIAAGVTNDALDTMAEDHADPFLVRVAADEEVSWERTYQPDAPNGRADAIVRTGSGYVVAGDATVGGAPRAWATAIDEHGTAAWEWTRVEDGTAGNVETAVALGDGVVLAGSEWPADVDDYGRSEEAWIARLTADGRSDWRRTVSGEKGDRIEALAPTSDGGIVALGRRGFDSDDRGVGWLTAFDGDGSQRWSRTYPQADEQWNWHNDLANHGDGYLLLGTREEPESDDRGAWLTRVDGRGRVQWEYQAESGTRGYGVRPLQDGGILLAGDGPGEDGTVGWLAKFGGDPAPPANGGLTLPTIPSWVTPLVAGMGLGALGGGLATRYWRQ